jgi:hypothetical protein
MALTTVAGGTWPKLLMEDWRETYATLHLWTQVVGKVCLALTPRTNHFWNTAFQITPRGLATPPMMAGNRAFTMTFDFVAHQLVIHFSDGVTEAIPLEPRSVADFYRLVLDTLHRLGVQVRIWPMSVEMPNPVRLDADVEHHSYDPAAANTFWRILVAIRPVFESFRCHFVGKCSPVHFFWGGFDLAVTRFSGDRAPERPGADAVTRESYSHAVISHGFWPGSGAVQEPAFYAYAAPEPPALKTAKVEPESAFYSAEMGLFILPYAVARTAKAPAAALTAFLNSTYEAAATLAQWNRAELERR